MLSASGIQLGLIVPLKQIEHGVYEDLVIIYPKQYSIYLRGTITLYSRILRLKDVDVRALSMSAPGL